MGGLDYSRALRSTETVDQILQGSCEQVNLANDHGDKEKREDELDQEHLAKDLDVAHARLPAEGFPGLQHTDLAAATNDFRDDLAAKGAVEGNDRLIILGQHRRGSPDKDDLSGNLNQEAQ